MRDQAAERLRQQNMNAQNVRRANQIVPFGGTIGQKKRCAAKIRG